MHAVILAAGLGTRLGRGKPKALARLGSGETILGRQLRLLAPTVSPDRTIVVVGYRRETISGAYPQVRCVVNESYASTGTARSLEIGLRAVRDDDAMFINGDVVFDSGVVEALISQPDSGMAVNTATCGDEEMKYSIDANHRILAVSKSLSKGVGEALGVNLVRSGDRDALVKSLAMCGDRDFFERGIEFAISGGMTFRAANVDGQLCVEVDEQADLDRANRALLEIG